MTEIDDEQLEPVGEPSMSDQFTRAVRDLWSMQQEVSDGHVVFTDRRRLLTRVDRLADGQFEVRWQCEDGTWSTTSRRFDNPREAAFRAFQGPH